VFVQLKDDYTFNFFSFFFSEFIKLRAYQTLELSMLLNLRMLGLISY
jgi:hypothetical protein